MQNLEDYTPEMLVFYQNLPAPVQNAVRHADVELEDLDSLAVFAENLAVRRRTQNGGLSMLLDEYYRADPELRDVWIALPGTVRAQILQWDARVTTKGELQKLAEGFAHHL